MSIIVFPDNYKLRITTDNIVKVQEFLLLSNVSDSPHAYCYEKAKRNSKSHFHLYIEGVSTEIRKSIKTLFGPGNAVYSLSPLDTRYPVKYIAYMMKDGVFTNVSIPPDVIASAEALNAGYAKVKSDKKKPAIESLLELYEASWAAECWFPSVVTRDILQWNIDQGKLIRPFYIIQLAQTILTRKCSEFHRHMELHLAYKVTDLQTHRV